MSTDLENYTHLLIPSSPTFRPSRNELASFFEGVVERGLVETTHSFCLVRSMEPQIRQGRNPFTGETLVVRLPTYQATTAEILPSASAIRTIPQATDFNVSVSGIVDPRLSPVSVEFVEEGSWKPFGDSLTLDVECRIRSKVVSTSGAHTDAANKEIIARFGEPCSLDNRTGYYTDPLTMQSIEVPGAGCASFWIEIGYGKWLFPRIENKNLAVADPVFVRFATDTFNVEFLQGCHWG